MKATLWKGLDMARTLFVLGGNGFIGHEVVIEALTAGWQVKALVHSAEGALKLQQMGVQALVGDAQQPEMWINEARNATVLIDLVQPKLPSRISRVAIRRLSTVRQTFTRTILAALHTLPLTERPLFFSVSGADDLQPDAQQTISHSSLLRSRPQGFAHIGIPVRQVIEASGMDATYVYLGGLVYGPGKAFVQVYVTGLAKGNALVIGRGTNRLPLVHVTDAARALVHLAGLPRINLVGKTFIAMDGADSTQRQLLDDTAAFIGVKQARTAPTWLASLFAGPITVETITLDAHADSSALLALALRSAIHRIVKVFLQRFLNLDILSEQQHKVRSLLVNIVHVHLTTMREYT